MKQQVLSSTLQCFSSVLPYHGSSVHCLMFCRCLFLSAAAGLCCTRIETALLATAVCMLNFFVLNKLNLMPLITSAHWEGHCFCFVLDIQDIQWKQMEGSLCFYPYDRWLDGTGWDFYPVCPCIANCGPVPPLLVPKISSFPVPEKTLCFLPTWTVRKPCFSRRLSKCFTIQKCA